MATKIWCDNVKMIYISYFVKFSKIELKLVESKEIISIMYFKKNGCQ